MKRFFILGFITITLWLGGIIWGILEIIDYVKNDDPFNWWVVGLLVGAMALHFLNGFLTMKRR